VGDRQWLDDLFDVDKALKTYGQEMYTLSAALCREGNVPLAEEIRALGESLEALAIKVREATTAVVTLRSAESEQSSKNVLAAALSGITLATEAAEVKSNLETVRFVAPDTYTWLCDRCRSVLESITELYRHGEMPDTDDTEAPSMHMYDNELYCGGSVCKNSKESE